VWAGQSAGLPNVTQSDKFKPLVFEWLNIRLKRSRWCAN